jgi:hypothetical protein
MAKRTVSHALFSWHDAKGAHKMALRGTEIDLSGDELKRAEELGAVVEGALEHLHVPVIAPTPPVDPAVAGELNDEKKLAAKAAPKKPAAAKADG